MSSYKTGRFVVILLGVVFVLCLNLWKSFSLTFMAVPGYARIGIFCIHNIGFVACAPFHPPDNSLLFTPFMLYSMILLAHIYIKKTLVAMIAEGYKEPDDI